MNGGDAENVYEYGGSGRLRASASLCVFNVGARGISLKVRAVLPIRYSPVGKVLPQPGSASELR